MTSMLLARKFFLTIFIFVCFFYDSYSEKKYTGFDLGIGLAPNFNFHNSSFSQFQGYPNCCSEFKSGFGLGYTLKSFLSYTPKSNTFDRQWGFNFILSYDDISGTLKTQDFFANIIQGNEVKKGISEHKLKSDLSLIAISPELFIQPVEDIKLNFSLGFRLGLFAVSDFSYSETLVSPENASFENYTRTRNNIEGKIPDVSALNFAISVGADYTLLESSDLKLLSSLRFNCSLSNIVNNLNWKVNNLQLGLNIAYKIPKADIIPPAPAPLPRYPEPPMEVKAEAGLIVSSSGIQLKDGEIIELEVLKEVSKMSFPLLPIIFFEHNSSSIPEVIISPANFDKKYSLNKEILNQFVDLLKKSPDTKITITASATNEETEGTTKKRYESIANYLELSGINKNRILMNEKILQSNRKSNKANDDENYFVQLQLNPGDNIYLTESTERINSIQPLDLQIKTESNNPGFIKEIVGKICLNDNMLDNFYTDSHRFILNETNNNSLKMSENNKIYINALYTDITGETSVSNINYVIKPKDKIIDIFENRSKDKTSNILYNEFILGFFNFNESDFNFIDSKVKELVIESLNNGKRVDLFPYTDNIGSPEFNASLAKRRAESALRELKIDRSKVSIQITGEYPFSNETPHQRIYNRSVFIRIYE